MTQNPWITHAQPGVEAAEVVPVARVHAPGPLTPQAGVTAPDLVDQLPMRQHPAPARLWVVGTHGGAGESTLAALIPGSQVASHAWPRQPANSYVTTRVLLVARSNAAGLEAARKAATHWASGALAEITLLGLVIVADAPGRLPKPLRHLADHVAGASPRTWRMPWVEAWRLGEPVTAADAPNEVRRLAAEISLLLPPQGTATGGTH